MSVSQIEYPWSPSERLSAAPVTVTVCSEFQFEEVKVRESLLTVPSVVSEEATLIFTSIVGLLARETVNVAVVRLSSVSFEIPLT